ncbi:hypothetical protein PoB_001894500 [Plakobranchus ocellatus]|uniref:Uncharacterized protein n=1 Tax=Plakobranchus ocellatus TaxID=259542 RepID=A0AAV3ZD11_9GAST|nr:hypothetical protein PoB_001894500 [Plakobranchus ocellatus]
MNWLQLIHILVEQRTSNNNNSSSSSNNNNNSNKNNNSLGFGVFLYIASPQQGDLRLLGPPSGQGTGSGARTRNRRVPADLRADSLATVPPTPQQQQ